VLLLAAAMMAAQPAPAAVSEPLGRAQRTMTTAEVFALAERAEQAGEDALAQQVLAALLRDPDPQVRAEARFRRGQLAARRGNWRAAADDWTALLDEQPGAVRVRLELANALAQLGEEEGARRQLRRARAIGLPGEVAQLVDRFDAALRAQRRTGVTLEVALAPDSNINHAGDRQALEVDGLPLELDEDAVARSGVGLALSTQAFARPQIAADLNLLATLSAAASLYREGRFNEIALVAAAGPEWLLGRARLRLRALAGATWFGQRPYSGQLGATLNALAPVGRLGQAEFELTVTHQDYRLNDGLDGAAYSGTLRLERAFSPRLWARVQLGAARQAAREPAYANWSWSAQLLAARDVGRATIYASGTIGETKGDGPFVFPNAARRDSMWRAEAGLNLRAISWHGLSPVIRLSRTVNRSNIFFYDYARTRLELGLTREF
jgi:hypothetical protein